MTTTTEKPDFDRTSDEIRDFMEKGTSEGKKIVESVITIKTLQIIDITENDTREDVQNRIIFSSDEIKDFSNILNKKGLLITTSSEQVRGFNPLRALMEEKLDKVREVLSE